MELLFDVGGTNSRIGVSKNGLTIARHEIVPTPTSFEAAIDLLSQRAAVLTEGSKVDIAVMGLAGPMNRERTALAGVARNIADWIGRPLKSILEDRLKVPTYLQNDAVLAGLGEAGFGAGKGYNIVGYLTFSTGIGGAKIINGQPEATKYGSEPAFMIAHANKDNEEVSIRDNWDHRLAGWYIEQTYGKKPEDIKDPQFWNNVTKDMALLIHNLIVAWCPEIMVIGGGLTKSISLVSLTQETNKIFIPYPEPPDIKFADLGDIGGLYGAMQYANVIMENNSKKASLEG